MGCRGPRRWRRHGADRRCGRRGVGRVRAIRLGAEALAALDPTAPDLFARDVEQIWMARTNTAFMTNDGDEIERAAAWLRERTALRRPDHRSMALANVITGTLSAPDPAVVARLHRLAQACPSPSVQAIAGLRCMAAATGTPSWAKGSTWATSSRASNTPPKAASWRETSSSKCRA